MALESDVADLSKRVEFLEARLARLEMTATTTTTTSPAPLPSWAAQPPPPTSTSNLPINAPPSSPPPAQTAGRELNTEAILKWTGLGLVVLAAVFFVGTAINRGWIGPEMQLAGASLIGLAMLGGAFRLETSNRSWSVALALGGAIVLPICAAAANAALELWPNGPALISLAVVGIALVVVARRLEIEAVAAAVAVLLVGLPFWIGEEPRLSVLVIGAWMAALAVAFIVVGIAWRWTGTRLLATVASTLTLLLVVVGNSDPLTSDDQLVAMVVLGVVGLAAWIAPAAAARVNEPPMGLTERTWRSLDPRLVLYLPLWALAGIAAVFEFDRQDTTGWIGAALALALAVLSVGGRRWSTERVHLSQLLGIGVLLTVSLALLVDGPALLAALVAQAAATALLAYRFEDLLLAANAALLAAFSMLWGLGSILIGLFDEMSAGQHLANGATVLLPLGLAIATRGRPRSAAFVGSVVVGWVMALVWAASVLIGLPQGQVLISIVWAVAAAGAILFGVVREWALARNLGLATLAVVLIKLLSVDLKEVDTLWRVGLFFVIGAGLARLGYLLPRLGAKTAGETAEA